MKLTPTQCEDYIRKSRDTLYKAMKSGKLSYEQSSKNRLIDLSELGRWHEAEGYGPLKTPKPEASESVGSDIRSDRQSESTESSGSSAEIELLKLQVKMMEDERERERESVDELKESLKEQKEAYKSFMNVLTDQRDDEEKAADKEKEEQAQKMAALERQVVGLKRELQKSWFQRWLESRGPKKKPVRRPIQTKSA